MPKLLTLKTEWRRCHEATGLTMSELGTPTPRIGAANLSVVIDVLAKVRKQIGNRQLSKRITRPWRSHQLAKELGLHSWSLHHTEKWRPTDLMEQVGPLMACRARNTIW